METSISINFNDNQLVQILYGEKNSNLRALERALPVQISSRGNYVAISGNDDEVKIAAIVLQSMYKKAEDGKEDFSEADVKEEVKLAWDDPQKSSKSAQVSHDGFALKTRKKTIFPFTDTQKLYLKSIQKNDIVFGIGAAGTGKTYLAVAMAVSLFLDKKINKIILTRPAVEAGEKLGFLPGDMKEKVDPYLQPLYDALYDMLPSENVDRYFATKELQIAPLAFMRGRTLSNAFVILDEAQNASIPQMKMFLTRLGQGSKMIITGDLSQIDLPKGINSGLIDAIERLKHLKEISIIRFGVEDLVRHPLTAKIIESYEQA
jgi:phosphate starvation-inducible protein PhoH and related proteins